SLRLQWIGAMLLLASLLTLWEPAARWIGRMPSFVLFPAGVIAAMDLSHWHKLPAASLFVLFVLLFEAWKALAASFQQQGERMSTNFGLPSTLIMLLSFAWIFTVTYDQAKLLGSELFRDTAPFLFFLITAAALGPIVIRPADTAGSHRLTTLWVAIAGLICIGLTFRVPPVPIAAPPGILRVATFNIYQGFDVIGYDNRMKLADFVQSRRPLLLGLQESDTSRPSSRGGNIVQWLALRSGAYSFFGPSPGLGSYGVSVISELPILEHSIAALPSIGEQAHLVWTRHRWGTRGVTFLTTHFGLSDADHIRQMEETIRLIRTIPGPKIIAGDFNVDPRRTLDRKLLMQLASEAGLMDVLAPEGYDAPSASVAPTHIEGGRIDTLFVSRDFRILQARPLPDAGASDHFPVIADLQWR
ncbi:MAG TPA: endonuclease/exonuclease/phosphatase family protein, partial [Acidobacteriota bacterium]|nr:endonuclease/exonuclease/phosphatase family protein [Acidobacteriota bacterium]